MIKFHNTSAGYRFLREDLEHVVLRKALLLELLNQSSLSFTEQASDEPSPEEYLSPRELEVLNHTQHGKSAEEVAIILGISKRTVEGHLLKIRRKQKTARHKNG